MGRYYAMDRDKRWERTKVAYEALVAGVGEKAADFFDCIQKRYEAGETDEFLKPMIAEDGMHIENGDSLVFFNFRSDRMRQIVHCLYEQPEFDTAKIPKVHLNSMTVYKEDFKFPVISPPQSLKNVLAETLSEKKKLQCHIAETEKYAHVTFFFNGGQEKKFDGEDRVLIASPKVPTYDLLPEMSSAQVASAVCDAVKSDKYDFVMCNFAPPDMVGHTGDYDATVKAVEATDTAIGTIYRQCMDSGVILMVTSDHGNAEKMIDEQGGRHTAHTTNKVPFIITETSRKLKVGEFSLCDVAPTVLDVLGLPQPAEMTGESVLQ